MWSFPNLTFSTNVYFKLPLYKTSIIYPQDCSELPLFASVDPAVASLPTFAAFSALFDNYVTSPGTAEDHTAEEVEEELQLLQEVVRSDVMQAALQFLIDRGN